MTGFARMHEKGRRTRARQGRGNFAANMAGLSHTGDDDTPGAVKAQCTGGGKIVTNSGDEIPNRLGFNFEHALCPLCEVLLVD
jgi:hypothetical protein